MSDGCAVVTSSSVPRSASSRFPLGAISSLFLSGFRSLTRTILPTETAYLRAIEGFRPALRTNLYTILAESGLCGQVEPREPALELVEPVAHTLVDRRAGLDSVHG